MFDITHEYQNSFARTGVIHTPHGDIETPAFVGAATKATVKALTMTEMNELGSQAILANTYHLILQPGTELIAQAGGLAEFNGWHKPTFTDSGGFQIFSLPDVKISEQGVKFRSVLNGDIFELTPEGSMQAQWQIGADIHMAFDHLAKSENYADMKEAMERTHAWLERCVAEHQRLGTKAASMCPAGHEDSARAARSVPEGHAEAAFVPNGVQYLYAVVQGGTFLDLRAESARFCAAQPVDGFGIGGVFTADGMAEMLQTVHSILPKGKPRHLLGMGQEPIDIFVGAEFGIDTFDCVGPTRMARNGSLYTPYGRVNIKNAKYKSDFTPVVDGCDCELCKNHTRAYLHHLFKADEITGKVLASIHNEHFVVRLTDQIRGALRNNTFEELKQNFLSSYYKTI